MSAHDWVGLVCGVVSVAIVADLARQSRRNLERAIRAELMLAKSMSLCSACGDPPPSNAHERGWRFETCRPGGGYAWRCGECRRGDADPVPR